MARGGIGPVIRRQLRNWMRRQVVLDALLLAKELFSTRLVQGRFWVRAQVVVERAGHLT